MPYRVFQNGGFDAETIGLMTGIFDEVCTELRLANREDRLRDLIAFEITQCVNKGERDPAVIRTCARKALHMPS